MNPAEVVHKELGIRPLARALGIHANSVYKWSITGMVPQAHWQNIIELSEGRVSLNDLLNGRPEETE